jgi:hypothetical protein
MTVATREPGVVHEPKPGRSSSRLFEPEGATLEDAVLRIWDDLLVDGRADCPVCRSAMTQAGRCEGCGAELS